MHVYIGSRTTRERHARGDGISVFDYAPDTGALTPTQVCLLYTSDAADE